MILMDIAGPGPELICLAGFFPFILIVILIGYYIKISKNQDNNMLFFSAFSAILTLTFITIFFLMLHWNMIDTYWFFYNYSLALYTQLIIFTTIIFIGFVLSILILKKMKRERKQLIMSIILSVSLIVASIISAIYINNLDIVKNDHEYIFQLTLETEDMNSFILYCPYMYKNNKDEDIYNDNDLKGNFDIEIISNESGYKMKIDGTGPIEIDYHYEGLEHFHFEDSLYYQWNKSGHYEQSLEYLVYYNSSNNASSSINIKWAYLGVGSEHHITLEGNFSSNGWQVMKGHEGHVAIA